MQSGSDYRIRGTNSVIRDGVGISRFHSRTPTTTFECNPIATLSEGSNLRVHSMFVNDNWRVNDNLTFNLGVRLDKNEATDGDGDDVGDEVSFSPRVCGNLGSHGRRPMGAERQLRPLHDGADQQPRRVDGGGRKSGDVPLDLSGPGDQCRMPVEHVRLQR